MTVVRQLQSGLWPVWQGAAHQALRAMLGELEGLAITGGESSVRLSPGLIETGRWVAGFSPANVATDRMMGLPGRLGMPADGAAQFLTNWRSARQIYLSVEQSAEQVWAKVYWEYPLPAPDLVQRNPEQRQVDLQIDSCKWDVGATLPRARQTQYWRMGGLDGPGTVALLRQTQAMDPALQSLYNAVADALHLALLAADIGPGDEVITTPFTFIATAEAIAYVGAKAVFVDIDPKTYNIDVAQVAKALTPRTRALLPVHLFGQPANIQPLLDLAQQHGLRLIEDCAQSFGASVSGRQTGSMGDVGAFSFFPSKNLGCYGDGGMVTTQSDAMAEKLRMLRNHGSKVRYYHDIIGYNSRLDELQAVVLRAKLPHIDRYNQQRRRVAHRYSAGLAGLGIQTPHEDGIGLHVYHQYTMLTDHREAIQKALAEHQIASAVYYPVPLHQQKVFAEIAAGQSFPVTESVAARCLSLPIYPELPDAAIDEICGVIRQVLQA